MHYLQLTRRNGDAITINLAAVAFIEHNTNANAEVIGTTIYFIGSSSAMVTVRERYNDILVKLGTLYPANIHPVPPTLDELNRRTLEEM